VVDYHGLGRRRLALDGLLMRPQLNGGTLGGRRALMPDNETREDSKRMSKVDQEIEAIKTVLAALEALDADVRTNVLEYVLKRLKLEPVQAERPAPASYAHSAELHESVGRVESVVSKTAASLEGPLHIKDFKEEKKPKSAIEMAALVAYYLENLAPAGHRKATIGAKDVETQFKIAEFPLPGQLRFTLPNAKVAGYFDSAGDGEYRLNAVGHNLVVHSMPRDGASAPKAPRRKRAKKTKAKRKA
jgi:hypothetical protein